MSTLLPTEADARIAESVRNAVAETLATSVVEVTVDYSLSWEGLKRMIFPKFNFSLETVKLGFAQHGTVEKMMEERYNFRRKKALEDNQVDPDKNPIVKKFMVKLCRAKYGTIVRRNNDREGLPSEVLLTFAAQVPVLGEHAALRTLGDGIIYLDDDERSADDELSFFGVFKGEVVVITGTEVKDLPVFSVIAAE